MIHCIVSCATSFRRLPYAVPIKTEKRGNHVTRSHELRFLALPTIVRLSNAKPTQEYTDCQINIPTQALTAAFSLAMV